MNKNKFLIIKNPITFKIYQLLPIHNQWGFGVKRYLSIDVCNLATKNCSWIFSEEDEEKEKMIIVMYTLHKIRKAVKFLIIYIYIYRYIFLIWIKFNAKSAS